MALFRKSPPKPEGEAPAKPAASPLLGPIASVILADLALRGGQALVRRGVERGLLKGQPVPQGRVVHGQSLPETVVGTVLATMARRSVPGALLVGGGLIAKALSDRYRARRAAQAEPEAADDGAEKDHSA